MLYYLLTNDHLSAISGIMPNGRLHMLLQKQALRSEDVVRSLQHPLHPTTGKLLFNRDSSPSHRSSLIRDFLANAAGE
jgi:hypothetical protein